MNSTEAEVRTRYSVQLTRDEDKKERRVRSLVLALIGLALAVIVVFAVLLTTGAGI